MIYKQILLPSTKETICLPYVSALTGWANSADPDQTQQNVVSYLDLHCLPLMRQLLDTPKRSQMDVLILVKVCDKYGNELGCFNP